MYLTMNRFKVVPERAEAFEAMWEARDSHLKQVPGFRSFALMKGPAHADHILYASHTIWEDEASFQAWTKSAAFRAASWVRSSLMGFLPQFSQAVRAALGARGHAARRGAMAHPRPRSKRRARHQATPRPCLSDPESRPRRSP